MDFKPRNQPIFKRRKRFGIGQIISFFLIFMLLGSAVYFWLDRPDDQTLSHPSAAIEHSGASLSAYPIETAHPNSEDQDERSGSIASASDSLTETQSTLPDIAKNLSVSIPGTPRSETAPALSSTSNIHTTPRSTAPVGTSRASISSLSESGPRVSIPAQAPTPSGIRTINNPASLSNTDDGISLQETSSNNIRRPQTSNSILSGRPSLEESPRGAIAALPRDDLDVKADPSIPASHKHDTTDASNTFNTLHSLTHERVTVKRGDSLARIFQRTRLSPAELAALVKTEHGKQLTRLIPGREIAFSVDADRSLHEITLQLNSARTLKITRSPEGNYVSALIEPELERVVHVVSGSINSSLSAAAAQASIPQSLTIELASIFGWTIDFSTDIRKGDTFSIVYDTYLHEGKMIRSGHILAAEFVNRGRAHQAVRYTTQAGYADYFTPEGESLRRAFLRYPLQFSRISSRFSRSRFHPVLGIRRPHLGVDFAAPSGTPIKASGDAKVVFVGSKGGYGKTVILKHGTVYTTLYAHMSRYARNLKRGANVKQGQVIGYVGSTGISTGPHLHYEFHVNGTHKDPLKVSFPAATPVPKAELANFKSSSQPWLAMLRNKENTLLASSSFQTLSESLPEN
jgi:murein DD-endopeptidase MepM/ murein hydrolase activator NlpD